MDPLVLIVGAVAAVLIIIGVVTYTTRVARGRKELTENSADLNTKKKGKEKLSSSANGNNNESKKRTGVQKKTSGGVKKIVDEHELSVLKGHKGHILGISWSPDNEYVVTTSADRSMKLWETRYLMGRDHRCGICSRLLLLDTSLGILVSRAAHDIYTTTTTTTTTTTILILFLEQWRLGRCVF